MRLQEKMQVANLLNYPAGLHIMNPAELIAAKSLYSFMVLVFPIIYGMERMTVL